MSTPFDIVLPEQWKLLEGTGYGQRQPVLLGPVQVGAGGVWLNPLDDGLASPLGESLPAGLAEDFTPLGLVQRLLHWSAALQRWCGLPVFGMGQVLAVNPVRADVFLVAVPYASPHAAPEALRWVAQEVLRLATQGGAGVAPGSLQALADSLRRFQVGTVNDYGFQAAAAQGDIPVSRVTPGTFAYGQGRRARWLSSALTDATSHLAFHLTDKIYTAMALRRLGLPGGEQVLVRSADEAAEAALALGGPVVVKPADRSQGKGVSVFLQDEASVRQAYDAARAWSERIVVERHVAGRDFRLTVFQGQVVKVVERIPASVVGDGQATLAELVERRLRDPDIERRSRQHGRPVLALDVEALALLRAQGWALDDVPPAGLRVLLRRRANTSTGGSTELVPPGAIHPDNLRLAVNAAQAVRLDLAGVDLLLPDPQRSWFDTGALVCEINAQPALGVSHLRQVYAQILHTLVGPVSRIPLVLLIGPVSEARHVIRWLQARGTAGLGVAHIGYASAEGVWDNTERTGATPSNSFAAAVAAIAHPRADAAVVAMSPEDLLRLGLPFDRCAAVLVLPQDAAGARRLAELWPMVLPHSPDWIAMPQVDGADLPPAASLTQVGARLQRPATAEQAWKQLRHHLTAPGRGMDTPKVIA